MILKHNYRYFLYYKFEKDGESGYGNCCDTRNCRILDDKDIKNVEAFIEKDNNLNHVILSNYILME